MNSEKLSPSDIVRKYVNIVWNEGDVEEAANFLAETCHRHDTDIGVIEDVSSFSLEDQKERLKYAQQHAGRVNFEILKLLEAGEFVTMIWDLTYQPENDEELSVMGEKGYFIDKQNRMLSKGIEVFRIVGGRIIEIWVTQGPWMPGHWGATQTDSLTSSVEMTMSAKEVIEDYVTRMWNKADPTAIEDYLAETCWRHDAGEPDRQFMQFDHAFQRQRAQEGYDNGKFNFQPILLLECGEFVTFVWNLNFLLSKEELVAEMRQKGAQMDENGAVLMKGMEVFHVVDGKVVEVWVGQCWDFKGHWGDTLSEGLPQLEFEVAW